MKRLILLCALLFAGCEVIGGIGGTDSANKSNTPEEPRIVFGESIDDVRIGDDTTTVVQKIGRPDEVAIGDFPGVWFKYTKGLHEGISMTIYHSGVEMREGVQFLAISYPYSGKTEQGLGVGSVRDTVLRQLGEPDEMHGTGEAITDIYRYEDGTFRVIYEEDKIQEIIMVAPSYSMLRAAMKVVRDPCVRSERPAEHPDAIGQTPP